MPRLNACQNLSMQFRVFFHISRIIFFRIAIKTKRHQHRWPQNDTMLRQLLGEYKKTFHGERCLILEAVLGSFVGHFADYVPCVGSTHHIEGGTVTIRLNMDCAAGESEILHVLYMAFNWSGFQWCSCWCLVETEKMFCRCHEIVTEFQKHIWKQGSLLFQHLFNFLLAAWLAFWLWFSLFWLASWRFGVDCWGSVPTPM